MKFQVILPKSVQKELDRLPDDIVNRILARLRGLEANPRPADVKKLKGRDAWRIRAGGLPRHLRNPRSHFADYRHQHWTPSGNLSLTRVLSLSQFS
jgi:hypothetical protein